MKLVYTYALGAYALRRAGSSPVSRTKPEKKHRKVFIFLHSLSVNYLKIKYAYA